MFKREFHDYVIHFKNDERFSIFVLYNINHNEIFEFRRYLNENLNKNFIRVNRFDAIRFNFVCQEIRKKSSILRELQKSERCHCQESLFFVFDF